MADLLSQEEINDLLDVMDKNDFDDMVERTNAIIDGIKQNQNSLSKFIEVLEKCEDSYVKYKAVSILHELRVSDLEYLKIEVKKDGIIEFLWESYYQRVLMYVRQDDKIYIGLDTKYHVSEGNVEYDNIYEVRCSYSMFDIKELYRILNQLS